VKVTRTPARIFFEEKDEMFTPKKISKNPTIHRGYGDLLAVERFIFKLNLLQQI
jgi:ADP-dependent phosphofructokinase/glucokinase